MKIIDSYGTVLLNLQVAEVRGRAAGRGTVHDRRARHHLTHLPPVHRAVSVCVCVCAVSDFYVFLSLVAGLSCALIIQCISSDISLIHRPPNYKHSCFSSQKSMVTLLLILIIVSSIRWHIVDNVCSCHPSYAYSRPVILTGITDNTVCRNVNITRRHVGRTIGRGIFPNCWYFAEVQVVVFQDQSSAIVRRSESTAEYCQHLLLQERYCLFLTMMCLLADTSIQSLQ